MSVTSDPQSSAPALPDTESVDPRYRGLDGWPSETAAVALWESQLAAVAALRPALPALAAASSAAADRLRNGGRLIYVGAGTSGRIAAQDGAELPPTFDWPRDRLVLLMAGGAAAFTAAIENAEDDEDAARIAIITEKVHAADVVLGVAASGATRFTCACLADAGARGSLTIGVANSHGSRLLSLAAHPVLIETGAEPVAGSTRMKAGTAQKVALNLFSTLVMLQLGRVHDGLMVDMRAGNAKLRARALRMLRHLTGAEDAAAISALAAADGHVKLAVLLLRGLDAPAARALLARHGQHLRAALAELSP
jgi:N-acetylmuramic acid 6-phosphate etherase